VLRRQALQRRRVAAGAHDLIAVLCEGAGYGGADA
jgi:hypothetical protein